MTGPSQWFLIQTRNHQGLRAEHNLRNQGYTTYQPLIEVERMRAGCRVRQSEPLFPNYLFIHLQRWVDNWHPIRSTRGVARLVTFADQPVPVADEIIDQIHQQLERLGTRVLLCPGDKVEITEGCFRGHEAIFSHFDGRERVVLFLNFLHQQTELVLPLRTIKRRA